MVHKMKARLREKSIASVKMPNIEVGGSHAGHISDSAGEDEAESRVGRGSGRWMTSTLLRSAGHQQLVYLLR